MKNKIIQEIKDIISVIERTENDMKMDEYNLERIKERLEKLEKKISPKTSNY